MKNYLSKGREILRNSGKIYWNDVRNVIKNPIALIVVLGLCVLPSLYAWFNIVACWDPYGNTNGIKVAVVNQDQGYTLEGKTLNAGDMIVEELKENNDIGWVFVEKDDADYGLTHGKYYACLEIPEKFSADLASIIEDEPVKPEIIYRVNEKTNAIAPKITDSGAKTVKGQVSNAFTEVVNEVIFDVFNNVGGDLDINKSKLLDAKSKILTLNSKMDEIEVALEKAHEGTITLESFLADIQKALPELESGIQYLQDASQEGQELIVTGQEDASKALVELDQRLVEMQKLNSELQQFVQDARKDVNNINELNRKIPLIISKVEHLQGYIDPIVDTLRKINNSDVNVNQLLLKMIDQLKKMDGVIDQQKDALERLKEQVAGIEIGNKVVEQLAQSCQGANTVIENQKKEIGQEAIRKQAEMAKILGETNQVKQEGKSISVLLKERATDGHKGTVETHREALVALKGKLEEENKVYLGGYKSIALPELIEQLEQTIHKLDKYIGEDPGMGGECLLQLEKLEAAASTTQKKVIYSQDNLRKITDSAMKQLDELKTANTEIITICNAVIEGKLTNEQLVEHIDHLIKKLNQLDQKVSNIIATLKKAEGEINISQWISDLNRLDSYITVKINEFSDLPKTITEGVKLANDTLDFVSSTGNDLDQGITKAKEEYLTNIKPSLLIMIDDVLNAGGNLDNVLATADEALPKLQELVDLGTDAAKDGEEVVVKLQEKFPEIQKTLGLVSKELKRFSEEDLDQIIHLLENNPEELGAFISSPINLKEDRLYHIPNYGSAMTPFYSTLAQWVGCLILASVLTAKAKPWKDGTQPRAIEEYFGKLMTFMTLTILQTLVIALGDKYLLGVYMVDWPLFLGFSLYSTVIFTIIVYTLLSVLGNVGKAMAIILLVLQVAGAGGTFPVEVMPVFYQKLNPFLPFTYSIGALREAVGGPVSGNLEIDFLMLTIFGVVFLIIGVLFKKVFRKSILYCEEKFHDSGIAG